MKSSIFKKQLQAFMIILLGSFLVVSILITVFFYSYLQKEKISSLEQQAARMATIYGKKFLFNPLATPQNLNNELDAELKSMLEYKNVHIFITDNLMQVQRFTSDIPQFYGIQITHPDLVRVLGGEAVSVIGDINGLLEEREITVGYPVFFDGNVVAAAFVSSPLREISATISGLLKILVLTSLTALSTAYIFVYITSSKISKPLVTIGEAAVEFASGNFDTRIDIDTDDEIGKLAESFNHMAKSLYSIEQDRRSFISNLSHDIRSPLTSMRGFLQAMLDGTIEKKDQERYLQIVLDETARISKLADDTLELSRLEDIENIHVSMFDINELIRRNIMMLHKRILEKNLRVQINFADEMSYVEADEEKIERVILNLLDNAVKFSMKKSVLTIETTLIERPPLDEKISIRINNQGPVIDPKDLPHIFDRFYKIDSSRGEDTKGTGLGLAIVKDFLKAHGEIVTATSTAEDGTSFSFRLPLAKINES